MYLSRLPTITKPVTSHFASKLASLPGTVFLNVETGLLYAPAVVSISDSQCALEQMYPFKFSTILKPITFHFASSGA